MISPGVPRPDKHDKQLIKAFSLLKTDKEIEVFLRDLLTISEIKEFSNRLRIARLLWEGKKSYLQIAKECKTSTTTVTRVNEWLNKRGLNGYQTIIRRLSKKS